MGGKKKKKTSQNGNTKERVRRKERDVGRMVVKGERRKNDYKTGKVRGDWEWEERIVEEEGRGSNESWKKTKSEERKSRKK